MELKFRDLRADEIECRIGTVKEGKGVSLLLYKDARCDQTILDETVGCMNWQRHHSRDNANCIVSIFDADKGAWVEKEDTGTESNTEKEKGIASDSFKRACVNWGIGRELYTAPFIWVSGASKYDKFYVSEIVIENKRIVELVVCRKDEYGNRTDDVAFTFPRRRAVRNKPSEVNTRNTINEEQANSIKTILTETNSDVKAFLRNFGASSVEDIQQGDYEKAQRLLQRKLEKIESEREGI